MENAYTLINSYTRFLDIMDLNESEYNKYIQEISFSFKNKKVTPLIEKSKKVYTNNMKVMKKLLKDHGIDINKLESRARGIGNSIKSDLKNNNEKSITKKIADVITKFIEESSEGLKHITDSKVKRSLLLFICIFIINHCLMISIMVISPQISLIIGVCIMSPIIEEVSKNIAIKGDYPWIYTGIFSGIEFVEYIIILLLSGVPLRAAIPMRAITVIMHFVTSMIQKYFKEKGDKIDDNTKNVIGLYIGITVHVIFNVLLIFNKKVLAIVGVKIQ